VVDDVPCAWIVPRASGAVAWILDHIFDPTAWRDLFETAGLSIPIAGDAAFRGTHGGWCVTAAGRLRVSERGAPLSRYDDS
jgi:hypothetical protein